MACLNVCVSYANCYWRYSLVRINWPAYNNLYSIYPYCYFHVRGNICALLDINGTRASMNKHNAILWKREF